MSSKRISGVMRLLIAGQGISAIGNGLVVPLTLIYLNQVRGIPLAITGTLFTAAAVMGLVTVPLAGVLLDRVGARPVLIAAIAGQALAAVGLVWAHSALTALPVLLLQGAALAPTFPAFNTLLAGLSSDPEQEQRAMALNFCFVNAALGAGAMVGAAVANVHEVASFQVMFAGNAVLGLVFCALVLLVPNVRPPHDEQRQEKVGYRDVLAPRSLRTVMVVSLVLAFTGYSAFDSGLPAYASVVSQVPVRVIALALAVNTVVIVVAQLFMLRLVRSLRRSRALALIGVIWSASWLLFGLSALPDQSWARTALVLTFAGLFGLGETVLAPTLVPLVNSLADKRVRGRANAMSTAAFSLALMVSPALSTGLISAGLAATWIGLLCVGCLGSALLGMRLGRQLTVEQDSVASPDQRIVEPELQVSRTD
ncbi:MFS transporter [Streptomyces sp. 13-12-16]|uniref:MFS transporter n=1 Tax=Streptomyces sp. 13-12-16 TaxID=1570823 RepID=UPI0015C48DD8|nr:MFS transporter [Streptomyces sp. 13-12-16]